MASEKNMIVRSPASHIPKGDLSEIRRQIEGEVIACVFDLDKGPDMASEEKQATIFKQMKSCIETFRHLNNRLHSTAKDLPTPVGLPQNTSSDIQQHFEEYIGDNSAIVTVDLDKTSKKSSKLDDPIYISSEVFHNYLENHNTDEHYYKKLMCTDVSKVEHDLEGIARQLKGTIERADASILQVY